jgi:hypothetical protein
MVVRTSTIVDTTTPCSVTVHVWDDGGPTVNAAVVDVVMEIEPRITQFVAPPPAHTPAAFQPAPPNTFITWKNLNILTGVPAGVDCKAFIQRRAGVDAASTTVWCVVTGTLTGGAPFYSSMEAVLTWP